eukprot:TRINITY_DN6451_c0_g1_i1.p1 TRINITY_DN6451_c0_g1~~TRINITY_DN6451_c0_g1_i1.p1  ORF type:complete len:615 (-),score=222.91 TRINITY_DN6451_c0_g1_i1:34-1878(-)
MVKVKGGRSKRVPVKMRHKVEKCVARARTQSRRDARKNPERRKKVRKGQGIPNLCPFKEELLHKIEVHTAKLEEEKARQKQSRQKEIDKRRNIAATLASAQFRGDKFERDNAAAGDDAEADVTSKKDLSKKQFMRKFQHVVDAADVVLEVLDARDPLGCRCPEAEQLVSGSGKRLVLVLNKVDLAPRAAVVRWVRFLRDEFPTVAFKCEGGRISAAAESRQVRRLAKLQQKAGEGEEPTNLVAGALGGATLLHLLKNYCRASSTPAVPKGAEGEEAAPRQQTGSAPKMGITVGVIGYPNTGKSSLINTLKRTRAVGVSATAGFTKHVSEIKLDRDITLLDSPGVVFDTAVDPAQLALRRAVNPDSVEDAAAPVALMLQRPRAAEALAARYGVEGCDVKEFLQKVAAKRGRLGRGGVPDVDRTAREVLTDWCRGKIVYWEEPPAQREGVHVSAEIVSEWAPKLDLLNDEVLAGLPDEVEQSGEPAADADMGGDEDGEEVSGEDDEEEEEEQEAEDNETMEEAEEEEGEAARAATREKRRKVKPTLTQYDREDINPQVNQRRKADQRKKARSQRKKQEREMQSLRQQADATVQVKEATLNALPAYDFTRDFKKGNK